jgi:hypothetical protein
MGHSAWSLTPSPTSVSLPQLPGLAQVVSGGCLSSLGSHDSEPHPHLPSTVALRSAEAAGGRSCSGEAGPLGGGGGQARSQKKQSVA